MTKPRITRIVAAIAATLALLVAAIGFLHTPMGKPWLMKVGGCPINESPASAENSRVKTVRVERGAAIAPAHAALGFQLETLDREGVRAWASDNSVQCTEKREATFFACKHVSAAALRRATGADEVDFTFRPGDRKLVSVTTYRFGLSVADARSGFDTATESLARDLGEPHTLRDAESLAAPYATASLAYRYRDLLVDVTATNLPGKGVGLMESYVSAVEM